jgi:hypothetical protein
MNSPAETDLPSLAVLAIAGQIDASTLLGMLVAFDVSAYNRHNASPSDLSNEEWIKARIDAKDGTTLQLLAAPLMWNIYREGGVFLADIRVFHPDPRAVMLMAHSMH